MENREISNNEELMTADIVSLSHELTYRRYLLNNGHISHFFQKISIPEYLALHFINETAQHSDSGRTYLKDIADKMKRPVRQISRVVKSLQDRGLLSWSHDGDGREGTYVTITEAGRNILGEEESMLKEYYGRVVAHYGRDNFVQLLRLMRQLEAVMGEEFEGMEVAEDDETDE